MSGSCYRTQHNASLMKASARLPEAREFIAGFDAKLTPAENAERALKGRWYGNASEAVSRELTRFFSERFNFHFGHLESLRAFLAADGSASFPVLNHFYMVLTDPYYRWAASDWLPSRLETGLAEISRIGFENEARLILPEILGQKSVNRYCRNILTALRDNGFLVGHTKKEIVSPVLSAKALGFMLYSLKEFGESFNDFDGSPLFRALLKPRDLLVPFFREGERNLWWEFTGDRKRLSGSFNLDGLQSFLREVGA